MGLGARREPTPLTSGVRRVSPSGWFWFELNSSSWGAVKTHAVRKACANAGIQVHPTGVCTGEGWFADQPVPQNGLYGYAGTRAT
jgi:hypothetical protein